eukprot:7876176-Lingulodinium_polyedra.AAC.1
MHSGFEGACRAQTGLFPGECVAATFCRFKPPHTPSQTTMTCVTHAILDAARRANNLRGGTPQFAGERP